MEHKSKSGAFILSPDDRFRIDDYNIKDNEINLNQLIIKYTNNAREHFSLDYLNHDNILSQVAKEHSYDMAVKNYCDHTNKLGEGPTQRALRHGYDVEKIITPRMIAKGIGENIAVIPFGFSDSGSYMLSDVDSIAKHFVLSWMQSPGHRKNILNPNYDVIGIGSRVLKDRVYATQNFK